ncbi:hypothetical protein SLV14_007015 [Streptomyces sp. Je 1-4]|uniref:hypothetical protein n=1 Tax=Streptomyces TaxID=1883 RepID=UPI00140EDF36|nr:MULTISPECIES: hypothetical protein [unclassified Streptomyces]QIK10203.1 hypothetical protein G7Z12_33235 [Streptomyces sp. ID38640]UYB43970.1 hypothetical protein SLV14_007015 [Streptomyces sp. Je 1-4]UZQ40396.1 hypothetical protein SLV14N_007015 [Streptomyces sp. Je 1-4] [Streptomyces sp. Je 1-4 4N24]UZQ47813.1 hypothetical protein SLV14NA_007015 [Streptomyces sp. Je 1-4] [Streptomyces sp. Je 1-4 4N24_ara]
MEQWLVRHYAWFGLACVAGYTAQWGPGVYIRDPLHASGFMLFFVALFWSLTVPNRMSVTLSRLQARNVLSPAREVAVLEDQLCDSARRWARAMSVVTVVLIEAAFIAAVGFSNPVLMVIEGVMAIPVGRFLGRAVCYGWLGRRLRANQAIKLIVQPGHVDGAAGLRPIGSLYLFQAMLVSLIALYLSVWWLLMELVPRFKARYGYWQDAYLGLFLVALCCVAAAFLLPMWTFHLSMREAKQALAPEADRISIDISAEKQHLLSMNDGVDATHHQEYLNRLDQRFQTIEKMPTWPVSAAMRNWFTANMLALPLPVLAGLVPVFVQSVLTGN